MPKYFPLLGQNREYSSSGHIGPRHHPNSPYASPLTRAKADINDSEIRQHHHTPTKLLSPDSRIPNKKDQAEAGPSGVSSHPKIQVHQHEEHRKNFTPFTIHRTPQGKHLSHFSHGLPSVKEAEEEPPEKKQKESPTGLAGYFHHFQPTPTESEISVDHLNSQRTADSGMGDMGGDDAMEVGGGGGGAVARSGSGPGMGAIGLAGISAPTIFRPELKSGTPFHRVYTTNTRWVLPACLTAYTQTIDTAPTSTTQYNGLGINAYTIGSSAYINLLEANYYMDRYDFTEIERCMAQFYVHDVEACVTALGVRAPYGTASSDIEVANSNLQVPIMELDSLQKEYTCQPTNDGDVETKIYGTEPSTSTGPYAAITRTTTFSNISSRIETRRWASRCNVIQQVPLKLVGADVTPPPGFYHSYPNILNHVTKMINGSNHLGLAFEKKAKIDSLWWDRTDMSGGAGLPNTSASASASGAGGTVTHEQKDSVDQGVNSVTSEALSLMHGLYTTNVYGPMKRNDNHPRNANALIFALYNIRNLTTDTATDISTIAYNNIVDFNFEFMLTMKLTASGNYTIPMYWNPTVVPTPNWHDPKWLRGTTDVTKVVVRDSRSGNVQKGQAAILTAAPLTTVNVNP